MQNHNKSAFTMLELIMVIVVLGILASLALPRMERDLRQEAGDNILSAIRYTQHLALMDNKTNPSSINWQRAFWQIRFSNVGGKRFYSIAANNDLGNNLDQSEAAIDPANGNFMHSGDENIDNNESSNIFLTQKYGINGISINDCQGTSSSTAMHIAFDHLGRPHRGVTQGASNDFRTYINNKNCLLNFAFESGDDNLTISISRETGYAQIVGQDAS